MMCPFILCVQFVFQCEQHSCHWTGELLCHQWPLLSQWYPQPGCTPPGSPLVWCHLLQPCRCEGGGYWLYVCKWYQHITWQKVFNVLSHQTRTFSDLCSSHELGGSSLHRYIYVSDIADHDIDVFERQDGEHLFYLFIYFVMNLIL